jgi:1,4-dihydroxy-2-naphthoate octaprenyltransferase
MTRTSFSRWVLAARLRTLPLACSSVLLGSGLAAHADAFRWPLFLLCLLTAILLQVLSNLANDYGDAVSGADLAGRVGPTRAVATGLITVRQMQVAMGLTALAAVVSGLALLWSAFADDWPALLAFIGFGALALVAAVTYTVGRRPYGYRGFGDLSVFLFFGLLGVMGSYYLYTHQLSWSLLLPAASCGLLATAVLNINNIRDRVSDAASGKFTLAVRLGASRSRNYHWLLVGGAGVLIVLFILLHSASTWPWLFLPGYLPLLRAAWVVQVSEDPQRLNQQLKLTALGSLSCNLLLALGFTLS